MHFDTSACLRVTIRTGFIAEPSIAIYRNETIARDLNFILRFFLYIYFFQSSVSNIDILI